MFRSFLAAMITFIALPCLAADTSDPAILVETVVGGLSSPSGMAFLGDDDLLVLEQLDGRVRRVVAGVLLPDPVLDLPVDNFLLDRGLLGIATDPDFVNRPFVYLFYVEADADGGTAIATRVTRFRWNGSALVEPSIVLTLPIRPGVFRIGGIVLFGWDDMLYTVVGDLQFQGKLQNFATGADPNDTSVILRTRADGSIPPDNPFHGSAGALAPMNRYYAYGIRNSFGLAVDPVNGALWDTENGQGIYDEINRVAPGMNSGWARIQGPLSRSSGNPAQLWLPSGAAYDDPEFSWLVPSAPTAIAFVLNPRLGCSRTQDALVSGTNCGLLFHLPVNAQRSGFELASPQLADLVVDNASDQCSEEQAEITFGSDFGVITDLETGPDGNIYAVSLDHGAIYRLVPSRPLAQDADQDGVESICDCNPADGGAWTAPGEVRRLRVSRAGSTHLGWDDPRPVLGPGTRSLVVSGTLAALRASGSFAGACTLGSMLQGHAWTDTRPDPAAGSGYYYLVRSGNSCAAGTFGDSSLVPDPRSVLDTATPSPCP